MSKEILIWLSRLPNRRIYQITHFGVRVFTIVLSEKPVGGGEVLPCQIMCLLPDRPSYEAGASAPTTKGIYD